MVFENFKQKDSVVVVYTGENKGKTSASLGLMVRALGTGWKVAYVQFIKHWEVGEHKFIQSILPLYKDKLDLYKGGLGFFEAGELSAKATKKEHIDHAKKTYEFALKAATSGEYQLVICDEINNAVHDGLLTIKDMENLINKKYPKTNLCFTGRNFPMKLIDKVDIATEMKKLKHHFDNKNLANKGIDF